MSNTNKADVIRKKWHPAGWMPAGFREMWEYAVDLERRLNAAECRIQDLEQAAPQAQEEPSGAPAPVPTYFQVVRALTNLHVDYCAKNCRGKDRHVDYCRELSEFVGKTYGAPESQPPAPASPGGRECEVIWRNGEPFGLVANLGREIVAGLYRAEIVRMVEATAAPEAGAPGTQTRGDHKWWCSKGNGGLTCGCAAPTTQTQEGGSQP